MASPTKTHIFCSLLMSLLFAYSASVQLDDKDWYFWLPLYSGRCVVNLLNWAVSSKAIRVLAEAALCLAILLFVKVVIEDIVFFNGISGFWSLDLSERVVREKTGSGLVAIAMLLQMIASSSKIRQGSENKDMNKFTRYVEFGMVSLVGFSYGLPFVFFVIQKGEMKFDQTVL